MGEGVLFNIFFTELAFKTVSCDITAFHRIIQLELRIIEIYKINISTNYFVILFN